MASFGAGGAVALGSLSVENSAEFLLAALARVPPPMLPGWYVQRHPPTHNTASIK